MPDTERLAIMAEFEIRIVNRDFDASNTVDAPDRKAARTEALKGALQIGTDEICAGKPFFAAEVIVSNPGDSAERLIVSIGMTPLR